jgi:hypothetical protein
MRLREDGLELMRDGDVLAETGQPNPWGRTSLLVEPAVASPQGALYAQTSIDGNQDRFRASFRELVRQDIGKQPVLLLETGGLLQNDKRPVWDFSFGRLTQAVDAKGRFLVVAQLAELSGRVYRATTAAALVAGTIV